MATSIANFFNTTHTTAGQDSDDFVLAPESMRSTAHDNPNMAIRPDEFKLYGKQYVRCDAIAKPPKHTKKRTSIIWRFGEDIQLKKEPQKKFWYCYLCEKQRRRQELPVVGKGNSTALDHLEQAHHIDRVTGDYKPPERASNQPSITRSFEGLNRFMFKTDWDRIRECFIRWIVYCHIAFFQVENDYFRDFLEAILPGMKTLLPKAANTIRKWVMDTFDKRKARLQDDLRHSRSKISISFDAWTSPNCLAIIGAVAHFIDKTGQRRQALLGLRELGGEHSGENMADTLLQLISDYKIRGRIGFFMADNASNNDTCIDLILQNLYPHMTKKQHLRRRLRCLGHIINLCAQAFLVGKDADKICKELEAAYRDGDMKKIGELWRKRGAIGRLHNIVRYIRASPQRRKFFRSIELGGDLAIFDGLEVSTFSLGRSQNLRGTLGKILAC
jgi:hypothetical protein